MHRTGLILLALLLVSPAAAGQSLPLSFAVPGQAGPDLDVSGADWVVLVFWRPDALEASLASSGDVWLREFESHQPHVRYLDGKSVDPWTPAVLVRNETLPGPLLAQARHGGSWGSLYVAGEDLRLAVGGMPGTLEAKRDAHCVPLTLREASYRVLREDGACPAGDHAVLAVRAQDEDPGMPFRLEAGRVREVEWHGLRVSCSRGDCPSGGARDVQAVGPAPGNVTVQDDRYGYANLHADMALHGNGTAAMVFAGGARLALLVDGWVRLPRFASTCGQCVGSNGTFFASGDILLGNLSFAQSGRLGADLSGDLASARLDETAIEPGALLGPSIASVVGAVGTVAILWKIAAWLAARHRRAGALRHPRRRRLLEVVTENPGIHFRALDRMLEWGSAPLQHHLDHLLEAGLLVQRRSNNTLCFFENHGRYGPEWRAVALLRDPRMQRLHAHLDAAPARRSQVVRHAQGRWGWSQRSAYRRIQRLLQARLLVESDDVLRALCVEDAGNSRFHEDG